jgi:hypothetical protein
MRNAITATILIFALGSLAYVFLQPKEAPGVIPSPKRPSEDMMIAVDGVDPDFAVYFFYNDIYCSTCEKLENYALETIKTTFADELEAGQLQWRTLDMRTPENNHFVEDFRLYSKSVVLVAFADSTIIRHKNLEEIWDKVADQEEYQHYITTSMTEFMSGSE